MPSRTVVAEQATASTSQGSADKPAQGLPWGALVYGARDGKVCHKRGRVAGAGLGFSRSGGMSSFLSRDGASCSRGAVSVPVGDGRRSASVKVAAGAAGPTADSATVGGRSVKLAPGRSFSRAYAVTRGSGDLAVTVRFTDGSSRTFSL